MVKIVYRLNRLSNKTLVVGLLKLVLVTSCFPLVSCLKQSKDAPVAKVSYSKLEIYPSLQTLSVNQTQMFYGINGVPPYTYSISIGTGTVDPHSGLFSTSTTTGTAVVKVVDSVNQEAVALVFIVDQLKLSPMNVNVTAGGTLAFSTFGGSPPYTYSISLGNGTIDALTGLFQAPTLPGTTIVVVTDKNGMQQSSVLTTVAKPQIAPASFTTETNAEIDFTTLGGVPPYVYSIFSGSGSIDATTGVFSSATAGDIVVMVRDKYNFNSYAQIKVINSNKIATGVGSVCAYLGITKIIKCWGNNSSGQLGKGNTLNIGDKPYEMGTALTALDFGYAGAVSPKEVSAGHEHFCATMENQDVKCWGNNFYGQLGLQDTLNRGDTALINTVPVISFGTGLVKPLYVTSGSYHNCVVFSDNQVKCWGRNDMGQLGIGSTVNKGGNVGDMGTSLAYTDLGTIDSIKTIKSSGNHTCILTITNKVKCWGYNAYGQLGLGDTLNRGDAPNKMGNNLPYLDFGALSGLNIVDLALGENHTCALFSNGNAKCWGLNTYGQLGLGDSLSRGGSPSQTPANLPYVDLGSFIVKTLTAGFNQTCAVDINGLLKCWGNNDSAQLGQSYGNNLGDAPGEMGTALPAINLGSIAKARRAMTGDKFTCVTLTDSSIKCFGSNFYGQMGLEINTAPYDIIGDVIGEMGDYLFPVNL